MNSIKIAINNILIAININGKIYAIWILLMAI